KAEADQSSEPEAAEDGEAERPEAHPADREGETRAPVRSDNGGPPAADYAHRLAPSGPPEADARGEEHDSGTEAGRADAGSAEADGRDPIAAGAATGEAGRHRELGDGRVRTEELRDRGAPE